MSTIRATVNHGRNVYVADLRDIGGGEKFFRTKAEAVFYMKQATSEDVRGGHVNPLKAPSFEDATKAWTRDELVRIRTEGLGMGEYANKAKSIKHLCELTYDGKRFGDVKITKVRDGKIELQIIPQLLDGRAHATAKKIFQHMKMVFAHAVKDGGLPASPVTGVKFPTRREKKHKQISKDVIQRIIDNAGSYSTLIMFAAYTGLRAGEIAPLTWDDIDFDSGEVSVDKARKKVGGVDETKTAAGERCVPIVPVLKQRLLELRIAQTPAERRNNLVFPTKEGTMVTDNSNWRNRGVKATCNKLELPEITFHDLRHFYASILVYYMNEGASVVTRLMGHADYGFTMKQYGHWFEDRDRDLKLGTKLAEALAS